LEKTIQRYFKQGLAESTRKHIKLELTRILLFVPCACITYLNAVIVSQSVLYMHIANLGLAYGTIRAYLAAIRCLHIPRDLQEPKSTSMPKLTLRGRNSTGEVIRSVGGNEPGPLIRLRDGLTKVIFITETRAALSVLGLHSSTYGGHTFKIGAATIAVEIRIL
jgi:hypothetical protein